MYYRKASVKIWKIPPPPRATDDVGWFLNKKEPPPLSQTCWKVTKAWSLLPLDFFAFCLPIPVDISHLFSVFLFASGALFLPLSSLKVTVFLPLSDVLSTLSTKRISLLLDLTFNLELRILFPSFCMCLSFRLFLLCSIFPSAPKKRVPWLLRYRTTQAGTPPPPHLEANLVIFGDRALIFFLFESSWKYMKNDITFVRMRSGDHLGDAKCRRRAPRSVGGQQRSLHWVMETDISQSIFEFWQWNLVWALSICQRRYKCFLMKKHLLELEKAKHNLMRSSYGVQTTEKMGDSRQANQLWCYYLLIRQQTEPQLIFLKDICVEKN